MTVLVLDSSSGGMIGSVVKFVPGSNLALIGDASDIAIMNGRMGLLPDGGFVMLSASSAPPSAPNTRVTASGDVRVTASGDTRVTAS